MTRRVARLFRPYRGRLAAVLALIALSAALGMVSPFLLRDILDEAIPEKDRDLLLMLVGGMIAISVATGVLSVAQTICDNAPISVKQAKRAMHFGMQMDLRSALFFEIDAYNKMVGTEDRHEGVRAFNEKRKPKFKGK